MRTYRVLWYFIVCLWSFWWKTCINLHLFRKFAYFLEYRKLRKIVIEENWKLEKNFNYASRIAWKISNNSSSENILHSCLNLKKNLTEAFKNLETFLEFLLKVSSENCSDSFLNFFKYWSNFYSTCGILIILNHWDINCILWTLCEKVT